MAKGVIKGQCRARRQRRNRNNMKRASPNYQTPQERKRESKINHHYHGGRGHGYRSPPISQGFRSQSSQPSELGYSGITDTDQEMGLNTSRLSGSGSGLPRAIGLGIRRYYHEPGKLDLLLSSPDLEAIEPDYGLEDLD